MSHEKAMPSRMYNYVRSRQLEDTFDANPKTGTWHSTVLRVFRGWGAPNEAAWPYDVANWPPIEPAGMDKLAKAHRIICYQRVRTLDELKTALSQDRLVSVAFDIWMSDWSAPANGAIPLPTSKLAPDSRHTVSIVGYDNSTRFLRFVNSWGSGWGDAGSGTLPYPYFELYQLEAWIIGCESMNRPPVLGKGVKLIDAGVIDYLADTPLHVCEIFDATADECIAWSLIVERQGFADIEEFFVRPNYRGNGYGSKLVDMILQNKPLSGKSRRLWIPHANADAINSPAVQKIVAKLGLRMGNVQRRWASGVAM